MSNKFLIALIIISMSTLSCSKDEGKGGRSSIKGKVYAKDFNASFTFLNGEYYAPDEDVFIIYGNNEFYDDDVKTDPNGLFEFKNLRKGNYTVYVYSKDSTSTSPSGLETVSIDVEIKDKKEKVELPDFQIVK